MSWGKGWGAKGNERRSARQIQRLWRLLRHLWDRLFILKELIGGDHGDAVPGADLMAERAADTAGKVDGANLERELVPRAGDDANAIDGADRHAGFAAGAHVLVKQRQRFRELLFRHG